MKLCKDLFNVDARHVLDPTMLLDKKDYLQLIDGYTPVNKNIDLMQYVFFFQHDETAIIEKVGNILGMKPVNLMTEKFLHEIKDKAELPKAQFYPVEEWLYGYSHSKFVITDSFHGTVFCIIFNVPFLVVSPEASTRQKSLLKMFGLSDRLVMTKEEVTSELINKEINCRRSALHKLQSQTLSHSRRPMPPVSSEKHGGCRCTWLYPSQCGCNPCRSSRQGEA